MSKAAVDLLELRFPDVQEKYGVDVVLSGRQRRPFNVVGSRTNLTALNDRYSEIYLKIAFAPFDTPPSEGIRRDAFNIASHAIHRIRLALEQQGAKP